MALNDDELLRVYCDLHKAFPEDVHIARILIHMFQQHGNGHHAGDLALAMSRRMLSMGWAQHAIGFIELCRKLHHPQTEEIKALFALASITVSGSARMPPEEAQTFTLIEQLSDQEALGFFRMAHLRHVAENDDVVRQGEMEKSCFLILEGAMRVHMVTNKHTHVHLGNLEAGHIFGEFACVYGFPRSATVTATKPGLALEFSDLGITQLIQRSPMAGEGLMHTIQMRMVQSMSRSHPAMEGIPETDQRWLAEESTILEFRQGNSIDADEACYVIVYGSVQAYVTCDGEPLCANMGIGDMFGEISAYLRLPPHTRLCATDHCLVCRIPGDVFHAFMNAHSGFRAWVKQHAMNRIQQWKQATDPG
ncbi:MAG: cyclic nucleotide-binding domain-containing protein [Mariprofundaceae bacterium]|nr:cyclic nucleotide-binding domain-containing protein [Mariprofundaceae bacterium]